VTQFVLTVKILSLYTMLSGPLITVTRQVHRLWMEGAASRYGRKKRIF